MPTLRDFADRFLDEYARANRQKPSGVAAKATILRTHLVPILGERRLDQITTADVQVLKARLSGRAPKTVNNVLTVLNVLLRSAVEWGVIGQMPCSIKLVKVPVTTAAFLDFDEYEGLVGAAEQEGQLARLVVLLGGDAGLRCGEMMALERRDVDLGKRQLTVTRSEWKGQTTATKGGRPRHVPLTARLTEALREARHLRGSRVLLNDDDKPLTQKVVQGIVKRAARQAGVNAGVHTLRHTFCSHLAMRGAPARAIQELAGHQDLSTTQRYMHLSPAALESAIQLLEVAGRGRIVETTGS